jgi:hypothetical protein
MPQVVLRHFYLKGNVQREETFSSIQKSHARTPMSKDLLNLLNFGEVP